MRFRGINIRLLFSLTFFSVFLDGGIIVGEGIGAGRSRGNGFRFHFVTKLRRSSFSLYFVIYLSYF